MPSDDTRRVLRMFGVAVTAYEDAVDKNESPEVIRKAETEVRTLLKDISELIERLSARKR